MIPPTDQARPSKTKKDLRSAFVRVRTVDGHHSLYATVPLEAGSIILDFTGQESHTPDRLSVQIAWDRHLVVSERATSSAPVAGTEWQFLNHSCAPNARVLDRSLVALQNIAAGEELTFDYNGNEWDMANPFDCWCGHATCVGLVRGYRWLDAAAREARREGTAAYLLDKAPSATSD